MYVEGMMGDLYLKSAEEVNRYQSAFERIQTMALSPQETLALISAVEREQAQSGKTADSGTGIK